MKWLLIACGGGAGAILRYAMAGWGQRLTSGVFPVGTLMVNTLGCLAIGFLASLFAGPLLIREEYRIAILVGFLGGFTTFSTYGYETFALLGDGEWWSATVNILLSNVLGLLALWIGVRLAEQLQGA
jgi:CrcB protein